jgi:hypothetical protein
MSSQLGLSDFVIPETVWDCGSIATSPNTSESLAAILDRELPAADGDLARRPAAPRGVTSDANGCVLQAYGSWIAMT